MLISTTQTLEGYRITAYHGVVSGEVVFGANVFRDLMASVRNIVGGRTDSYESVFRDGRQAALDALAAHAQALGANAVVGASLDYEAVGTNDAMLMVAASGTAVTIVAG
jgi:uncharacterized protein YbjQ (UPF0145 family)